MPEPLIISLIHKAWVDLINASQWNKKGVPENLANLTGKHLCWPATSLILDSNTAASLLN